jgi:FkbM family methyltransferase
MTTVAKFEEVHGFARVLRFLRKPLHEKISSVRARLAMASVIWPVELPFGALWFPRKDNLGEPLLAGCFEISELAFVERFLRPGMTVLDLGAHHGLYSLLASKRVGRDGRVFAFEPSPRERRALRANLLLNFCRNVSVQGIALGGEEREEDLFVVQGYQTGCNSLRPPDALSATKPVRVQVVKLDSWLAKQKIDRVDFIKLDVEGAELETLKGAARLLERRPRPVILAEVQDVRTKPWGYRAGEIIAHLARKDYEWFRLRETGYVEPLEISSSNFDGNFVACPRESLAVLKG